MKFSSRIIGWRKEFNEITDILPYYFVAVCIFWHWNQQFEYIMMYYPGAKQHVSLYSADDLFFWGFTWALCVLWSYLILIFWYPTWLTPVHDYIYRSTKTFRHINQFLNVRLSRKYERSFYWTVNWQIIKLTTMQYIYNSASLWIYKIDFMGLTNPLNDTPFILNEIVEVKTGVWWSAIWFSLSKYIRFDSGLISDLSLGSFNSFSVFFIFLISTLVSFLFIVSSPIYVLFSLIGVFVHISIVLFWINIEFFSMAILIVYVGAISILFLFVIILLNIREESKFDVRFTGLLPVLVIVWLTSSRISNDNSPILYMFGFSQDIFLNDTENGLLLAENFNSFLTYKWHDSIILNNYLYTKYSLWFLVASWLLLITMIGSISILATI